MKVFHFAEDPLWFNREVHARNQFEAANQKAGAGGDQDPPKLALREKNEGKKDI
jgi:hypothetical protein